VPTSLALHHPECQFYGGLGAKGTVADGLAEREAHEAGRVVLTQRGRLLADAVVRDLTG